MDLNLLQQLDPQTIAGLNLGPSLLTDPQIGNQQSPQAPPMPNIAGTQGNTLPSFAPAPTAGNPGFGPMPQSALGGPGDASQSPLAHLAAQVTEQAKPQVPWYQRILDAVAPIPGPYKALLSPRDQRNMQLDAVMKIGAGLTGAFTQPGQSQAWGPNLSRGLAASQQGMEGALNPLNQALEAQTRGVGLQTVLQRQAFLQQMAKLPPIDYTDPDSAQQELLRRASLASTAGLDKEATNYVAQANSIRDRSSARGGAANAYAPAEWHTAYDKVHPEPTAGTPGHALWSQQKAEAASNEGYGGTAMRGMQVSSQEFRQGNFATTSGQAQQRIGQRWTTITTGMAKDFQAAPDVKPLLDMGARFPVALDVLQKAASGDRAMYEQVGPQMANIFDPKARMQIALLERAGTLSKAAGDQIEATFDRITRGEYPQDQMQQALADMRDAQEKIVDAVERKRQEYVQKNPEVKSRLRSTKTLLNAAPNASVNPADAAAKKLLGTP